MLGKLYGVGVGPGDPELLTLKAVRIIKESDIIAIPNTDKDKCTAYKIVKQIIEDIDEKEFLYIDMPMTKDEEKLKNSHEAGKNIIIDNLKEGKNIAFLTLGDPVIYSTYIYIHKLIKEAGYETEIINGITSFCACAAKINEGLVEKSQELHIIPASYQIEESLGFPGTKVLMKSGKKISDVKDKIKEKNLKAVMIENCGMENEKVYEDLDHIPEGASYYSLIIVKEQ